MAQEEKIVLEEETLRQLVKTYKYNAEGLEREATKLLEQAETYRHCASLLEDVIEKECKVQKRH